MVRYTFSLFVENSLTPPTGYQYALDLTQAQEDNPEGIFTSVCRKDLRSQLQKQSSCAIREPHLNQIIHAWLEDIREGFRETRLTLDLPPQDVENIGDLEDDGNQELPILLEPDLSEIEPIFGMLPPLDEIFKDR
jgi:hypothetical protein